MDIQRKTAVIVAGGSGLRMGNALPKQFLSLLGKPVLFYTLRKFQEALPDMEIVLVLPEAHFSAGREVLMLLDDYRNISLVAGGETRFHSVRNGLRKIQEPSVVFIHDGVRPLLSTTLIHRCCQQALEKGSAIPAVPVKESLRRLHHNDNEAVDRSSFRIIQTPQTFRSEILLPAFEQPYDPRFTDEATVVESNGFPIHLIEGEEQNIKLTCPLDMLIAGKILESDSSASA